jgi:3-dehydroquinate dehydratase/shikimate dehydrogenase
MAGPAVRERSPARPAEAVRATVTVTVSTAPDDRELADLADLADGLEVRADLAGDLDPARLRSRFPGTLAYALRSGAIPTPERHRRLLGAADQYDLVELELDHDLTPELLARIPAHRRRLAWRGPAPDQASLMARFERMSAVRARLYLLAVEAHAIADTLAPLALLKALRRDDVTAFATGPAGAWTRLLAPRLGARVIAVGGGEPGTLTLTQLSADYGYPALNPLEQVYGIVGGSERHSLAPRILNTGFRALGIEALYLPFFPADFAGFWRDLISTGLPDLGLAVGGLTVVRPHKEAALAVAATAGARAQRAAAASCLVRDRHGWRAANTSGLGRLLAGAGLDPRGLRSAVIGCGGSGRSIAAELGSRGARVTLVNRGEPRGLYASGLLGLPWVSLDEFRPQAFDLVVNATPLARVAPFDPAGLAPGAAVADLAYLAGADTALIEAARRCDLITIDGRQVLAAETGAQFRLMTGRPLPAEAVKVALG